MKKILALLLLLVVPVFPQDQKVTQLTTTTSPASGDKLYIVTNPATSPASRAVTVASLLGNNGLTAVNVKAPAFGAVGNAHHSENASMTNGSATLTCSDCAFASTVAGSVVTVQGAGSGGAQLTTTISSRTSSTVVTLAATASTSVSSKRVIWGTNDTSAIASAASAASGKALYLPTGSYIVRMTATAGGAVSIPSNTTILGDGAGSVVYIIGSDGKNGGSSADDDGRAGLFTADNVHDVVIDGLHVIGENGTGSAFAEPSQNQSNAILLGNCRNVTVRNCVFEQLFGFAVHQLGTTGTNGYMWFLNNTLREVANGLNVNPDYCWIIGNVLYKSESIETSSSALVVADNKFISCTDAGGAFTSLSIGGRTAGPSGYGIIVANNIFENDAGGPISINDGVANCLIVNNTLRDWSGTSIPGINFVYGGFVALSNIRIIGNTISSSGHIGISIGGSGISEVTISDNTITGVLSPITDFATGVRIIGNTLQGSNNDMAPGPSTYVYGNKFSSPPAFDWGVSSSSFTTDSDQAGQAVASAATIAPSGPTFHVTGTTTITSVSGTGVRAGTKITLIFDGALTFSDGSNLKLAGSFSTTADDTITLLYDGSNWFEVSRSVN